MNSWQQEFHTCLFGSGKSFTALDNTWQVEEALEDSSRRLSSTLDWEAPVLSHGSRWKEWSSWKEWIEWKNGEEKKNNKHREQEEQNSCLFSTQKSNHKSIGIPTTSLHQAMCHPSIFAEEEEEDFLCTEKEQVLSRHEFGEWCCARCKTISACRFLTCIDVRCDACGETSSQEWYGNVSHRLLACSSTCVDRLVQRYDRAPIYMNELYFSEASW